MNLKLTRPLVFFDLETTGTDPVNDRIIEIGYVKVFPDGRELRHRSRVNPGIHIPEASTEVHHITDDDVKDEPSFKDLAKRELVDVFKDADLAGYNSNKFDIPMLAEEFLRAGVTDVALSEAKKIDVQVIYYKKEPRTLVAAYQNYCGKELVGAHGALADTEATYEVLKAQLDKYGDLENTVDFLSEYTTQTKTADLAGRIAYNERREPVFNFGKYKGQTVQRVMSVTDPGYYGWMMQADFPLETKQVLTKLYNKFK